MFQEIGRNQQRPINQIGFSQTARRCLERVRDENISLATPDWQDLAPLLHDVRQQLCLADDETVQRIIAHNAKAVRIAIDPAAPDRRGLIAILPLTAEGAAALISGAFSGINTTLAHIAKPGEPPAALYIWLVHMPGNLGRMIGALAQAIEDMLQDPAPVFARPATPEAQGLHRTAGFMRAADIYPDCADDLFVVLPERAAPAKPQLEVSLARSMEDLVQVFSVRSATYIAEQFCLYGEEFDGNDLCATHWLGKVNGDAAGCLRARFFADFVKIERLAVRAEYRNSRLAFQLVRAAIAHCQRKGYRTFFGHSRVDLQRFWKVFGFKPVADRPDFIFSNVKYAEMRLDLPALDEAITLDVPPLQLLRPEGAWDVPGPLEAPPAQDIALRRQLMAMRTRTVRAADIQG